MTRPEWSILKKKGCHICGKTEPTVVLEKAHLRASHKGGETIVPMCANHHRKYDKGILSDNQLKRLGITRKQYELMRPRLGRRKGLVGLTPSKKQVHNPLAPTGGVSPQQILVRRKIAKDELKSHVDSLSRDDPAVRTEALNQLAEMAFLAEIETAEGLLPKLAHLVNDKNLDVRRAALFLFERLSWRIRPRYRAQFNKKLLPLIVDLALHDEDLEVKKNALESLVASRGGDAVDVFVKLITTLNEEQYKQVIRDNTWTNLVYNGHGPQLRQSLFKAFTISGATIRDRISRETRNRFLG